MTPVPYAVEIFARIWADPTALAANLNPLNAWIKKMNLEQESEYYDQIAKLMEGS